MLSSRRSLIPAACAVALLAATPAGAATRGCARPHARSVLSSPGLRVVSVPLDEASRKDNSHIVGRTFLACARPHGRAHQIGTTFKEYATSGRVKGMTPVDSGLTSFGQAAGTFLVVRHREADLMGSFAEQTSRVVDVATGRRYTFFHHLVTEDSAPSEPAPPDEGYSAPPVGRSQVVAFSPHGVRTVLDEAPIAAIEAKSLRLADGVVRWVDAGQQRSAPAPG